jgi:hypothetical protein
MYVAHASDFQSHACYAVKLAEEAEDWVVRDNLLTLVREPGWPQPKRFRAQSMRFG